MHRFRTLAPLALALALGVSACGGASGSDASGPDARAAGPAAAATDPPAGALDACATLDPATISRIAGIAVGQGEQGASLGEASRCEFLSSDDGTDVAVQLGHRTDGPPETRSPLLSRAGFEQTFGGSAPVDGLGHDGFGFLDDSTSVAQAAVLSTDGDEYALVTLTGFDLTQADVDTAADLLREVEAER